MSDYEGSEEMLGSSGQPLRRDATHPVDGGPLPETMFRAKDFDDSSEEEFTPVKSWRYIEDNDDW